MNKILAMPAAPAAMRASLAAAMHDPRLKGNVVCVISGGNIDAESFIAALQGNIPDANPISVHAQCAGELCQG